MTVELARQIADALLYEGYILYPYRASAQKNQLRWQFGVLVPRSWSERVSGEPWFNQTEVILEPSPTTMLEVTVRCLHAQAKTIEHRDRANGFRPVSSLDLDGTLHVSWDEGVEHEVVANFPLDAVLATAQRVPFEIPSSRQIEVLHDHAGEPSARIVRQRWPVSGLLHISAQRLEGVYGVVRVCVRVENTTDWFEACASRDDALRRSLIAAHTLIHVRDGAFISLLDPPTWAQPAVSTCANVNMWPVLIGDRRQTVLSSAIILYDYPSVAPESPGDLYDATEIDELLTLRTMTLTDAEKREACATDDRAAAVINRTETLPPEVLERLHGALRYLRTTTRDSSQQLAEPPWWTPDALTSVSPETDCVLVNGVPITRGSHVRLVPGKRRADAQDMFLTGRMATVEAVVFDVDGASYVAVSLLDDPAADLLSSYGRFLYFSPDEVEPVKESE